MPHPKKNPEATRDLEHEYDELQGDLQELVPLMQPFYRTSSPRFPKNGAARNPILFRLK